MAKKDRTKMVIIWRKDLKVHKGKIGAQCAHGALGVILKNIIGHPFKWYKFPYLYLKFLFMFLTQTHLRDWLTGAFTKIVLGVSNEYELMEIYYNAKAQGLNCTAITDAGHTEFGGVPTRTVVAIGPDYASKIDKITGHLKPL